MIPISKYSTRRIIAILVGVGMVCALPIVLFFATSFPKVRRGLNSRDFVLFQAVDYYSAQQYDESISLLLKYQRDELLESRYVFHALLADSSTMVNKYDHASTHYKRSIDLLAEHPTQALGTSELPVLKIKLEEVEAGRQWNSEGIRTRIRDRK